LLESIAGTSPIKGNDFLQIQSVTQEVDGIHIWFQTVSGPTWARQSTATIRCAM